MSKQNQSKTKIIDLVIATTYACNSKCRMCNIWQSTDRSQVSVDQFAKLPSSLKDINLSGGEPFLRQDLPDLVRAIKQACPKAKLIISSNGFATELIEYQMKKILAIDPTIGVSLSLDGYGAKHEEVRRIPQAFEKTMATLDMLKKLGVKRLRLAFTAGDYNIDHLNKVYDLACSKGVEMTLAATHNAENFFNISENEIKSFDQFDQEFSNLIKKELSKFSVKHWLRAYFAYGLLNFVKTGKRVLPSYSGMQSIFLDPAGNIFPSDVSSNLLGNIKDFASVQELMGSEKATEGINKELASQKQDWMICTARSAIQSHPFKVFSWILKNKVKGFKV